MIEAVAVLGERGPGGFAGLDPASAPATAVLLERIAAQARAGTNPRAQHLHAQLRDPAGR